MCESEPSQSGPEALREADSEIGYWERIVEAMPTVVCRIAPDGTVRSINASGELITGYRREQLIGRNWWETFYPGDAYRQVEQLWRDLEKGDVRDYEMVLTRKQGNKRTICWTSINQYDAAHQLTEVVGFGTDVTEQKRTQQLMHAQRDLGITLGAEMDLSRALEACLEAALRASEMDCGGIYLINEQGGTDLAAHAGFPDTFVRDQAHFADEYLREQLIQEGDPVYLPTHEVAESIKQLIAQTALRVVAIVPVRHEGRTIACLATASRDRERIPAASRDALEAIAAQIGTAIVRIRAEEKLREEQQFLKTVLELQEKERRLIAYEIHDGLAQQLAGCVMRLQALRLLEDRHGARAEHDFDALQHLLSDGVAETRRLIAGLRPMILDERGVVAAIEHLVHETRERCSMKIDFVHAEHLDRLVPPLETALYRFVQEALHNACRHSHSDSVLIELAVNDGRIRAAVEDWGVGFDPQKIAGRHYGLRGMRERARLFGGRAVIDTAPGLGACVSVEFPLLTDSLDEQNSDP